MVSAPKVLRKDKDVSSEVKLSVVVPVYNGAQTIERVVDQVSALHIEGGLEIILVNDGSYDDSAAVCTMLVEAATTPMTFVNLARNFGEHNAVMAGLRAARGRYMLRLMTICSTTRRIFPLFTDIAEITGWMLVIPFGIKKNMD
jgi:cellulose synthase/poly-beta-1,6-N-acetylglucosamine synthase-like glycosyltransferase